ncbi:hypothetical protein [Alloyangia pacifica]|uniref:hypothetical protein n=1 Tax=Alloyangia pacifica TaxID=311180 RepID=UPI001FDF6916|nr:hypothetical protein [Alloyangia pacifica]
MTDDQTDNAKLLKELLAMERDQFEAFISEAHRIRRDLEMREQSQGSDRDAQET